MRASVRRRQTPDAKRRTFLCVGGGTLGPVTPLLEVAHTLKELQRDISVEWAGTRDGPEARVVTQTGIPYSGIPIAKIPRYPSVRWFTWPYDYLRARCAAYQLLKKIRPSLVIGFGGFTQVPIMHEAHRRRIPCVIHQLDVAPTLSNRIVARFCRAVTTSFEYPMPVFGRVKTQRVSTPCKFADVAMPKREEGAAYFSFDPQRPILFVFGGGTGALAINQAIARLRDRLSPDIQFVNVTGVGRGAQFVGDQRTIVKEFLDEREMLFAYAAADIVICRAGMGTLAELAALRKAAIVIPIPNSHQEANAQALQEGIERIEQREGFEDRLQAAITRLLNDPARCRMLGATLHRLLPTDDGSACSRIYLDAISR